MTSRLLLSLAVVFLTSSCAMDKKVLLPDLSTISGGPGMQARCAASFPKGRWQFVHSIAFHMADGAVGTVLGVVVLVDKKISCALMTVEGLALFEAQSTGDDALTVLRAIPPFANKQFAAGLMRDIRTIFQQPPGTVRYGYRADGSLVCRYLAGSQVTDILPQKDGCWSIDTYRDRSKTQSIRTHGCKTMKSAVIPSSLKVVVPGPAGYTLDMLLISAEPLPAAM